MRDTVKKQNIGDWKTRVKKPTFQGDFIKLQIDEKENMLWKSFANNRSIVFCPEGMLLWSKYS